jgi:hypothetical protein
VIAQLYQPPVLHLTVKQSLSTQHNNTVNAPGHLHPAHTTATMTKLLEDNGFETVHAEIRGILPVWEDKSLWPPCLIVRARKGVAGRRQ